MTYNRLPGGGEVDALIAPAGTRIAFNQAAAPSGWVSDPAAALADCSMRINAGTAGAQAGTTAWSNWNFGGSFSVNGFTLSTAQLPAHNHAVVDPGHLHSLSDPGHFHTIQLSSVGGGSGTSVGGGGTTATGQTSLVSTGIGVVGNTTGVTTSNTGTGSTITPTYTTPQVKYTDFLIGIKS